MTIQQMFEREDIYGILEKTMHEYYSVVHGKDVEVKVCKMHIGQKLLIYPRLGIVVSRCPSWKVIRRTYVSFDVQGNLIKKLVAWSYITLCFMTFGLLANASLKLSDYSVVNKGTIIIPSNRKIRIYEYLKGYVDSYLKEGFNDKYFRNEVLYREKPYFNFILGFLATGPRWYREGLLFGRCLVRVPKYKYDDYLKTAKDYLDTMHAGTTIQKIARDYLLNLTADNLRMLESVTKTKDITCGDKILKLIDDTKQYAKKCEEMITLSLSHGDLQTGNVYLHEVSNKLYFIDWETAKYRSQWYDMATLVYSTRRRDKFSALINRLASGDVVLDITNVGLNSRKTIVYTLLMEELQFFLEEIMDLPSNVGAEIIDRFIHELNQISID